MSEHQQTEGRLTIRVDEGATLADVERRTLYGAIRRNEVPGVVRIGRTVRLHRETFLHFLRGLAPGVDK